MLLGKRHEDSDVVVTQTLEGHTQDNLVVLKALLAQEPGVRAFCARWGLVFEHFAESAFYTIALHDVGKAITPFQERISSGRRSPDYPHAFHGLAVMRKLAHWGVLRPLLPEFTPQFEYPLVEALAVAAHHTQLHRDLYQSIERAAGWHDEVQDFLTAVDEWHGELGFDRWFEKRAALANLPLPEFADVGTLKIKDFLYEFCMEDSNCIPEKEKVKLKAVYTFLLSLLKTGDINSSIHFGKMAKQQRKSVHWGPLLQDWPITTLPPLGLESLFDVQTPYPYQVEMAQSVAPYAMLLAPCGRGKTKAAAAWATALVQEGLSEKLVFAMPTQVTSNAMRDTLSELFGEDMVGLYHGRSLAELRTRREERDTVEDFDELRTANFKAGVFDKPVVVTTVDHLIYAFLHGFRQADFTLGNLQRAAIVFDEVHYYEHHLLAHLHLLFRTLREMQIPHLLMSGTFPDFFREKIEKDAGAATYRFFCDDAGMTRQPFVVERGETPIVTRVAPDAGADTASGWQLSKNLHEHVLCHRKEGRVQFLILNTVRRAQEVYRLLGDEVPSDDIALLHSRFTYNDRREKERSVLKRLHNDAGPFILVATQVIEISLDISADVMFTEVAPADALGQRGGRLNRGGAEPEHEGFTFKLVVCPAENVLPYKESEEVVKHTFDHLPQGAVSYADIRAWCQEAYGDVNFPPSNFLKVFRDNTLFGSEPSEIRFSEDEGRAFQTRERGVDSIEVVPWDVYRMIGEESLRAEHLVSVPFWWLLRSEKENLDLFVEHERERDERRFHLCKVPYNAKLGFDETALEEGRHDAAII